MIHLDLQQGTPEWEAARIGIPTASGFSKILTPKTMKPSSQAVLYRNQLIAEWLLGRAIDWSGANAYMERGTGMEVEARTFYELQNDVEIVNGGFVMRDDRKVGGSPDGLIDDDGGVELKCPMIHTHIGYVIDPASLVAEYHSQVQGYFYLTGRKYWDIQSYNPVLPAVKVRIERDEKYIAALGSALDAFVANMDAVKEQLAEFKNEPVAA